jgi:hypothetical protein
MKHLDGISPSNIHIGIQSDGSFEMDFRMIVDLGSKYGLRFRLGDEFGRSPK